MRELYFPLINGLLAFIVFIFGAIKYRQTKDLFLRRWSFAFLAYAIANMIHAFTISGIIFSSKLHFILVQFARQSLVSLFFVILLYGLMEQVISRYDYRIKLAIVIFIISELLLLYFDIVGLGLVGELIHIIILDLPFNFAIGFLFLYQFYYNRDTFSLLNGIAWMTDVVLFVLNQSITEYPAYKYILYSVAQVPMFLIAVSMIALYYQPERKIIDLSKMFSFKIEARVEDLGKKYNLKNGSFIVFNDPSKKIYDYVKNFADQNVPVLLITRQNPDYLRNLYKFRNNVNIFWLTKIKTQYMSLDPNNIENMIYVVNEFVKSSVASNSNAIILLDGLEYISLTNTFLKMLHATQLIKDYVTNTPAIVISPIVKDVFHNDEFKLIEKEFEIREL